MSEIAEKLRELADSIEGKCDGEKYPTPSGEEIQCLFNYTEVTITGVALDMATGTLYNTKDNGALLNDDAGNWFCFGKKYTNEVGEIMADMEN